MSLALNDLRVVDSMDGDYVTIKRVSRPVTLADLVEILPTIGAENVWWCERHSCGGQPAHCSYGFSHKIEDVCRMIPVLVLKVEDR